MARTMRRWSDHDSYWGPFTYAKDDYRTWAIVLRSGEDEYPGCSLRFSGFSRTLIIALPNIIRPWRRWVDLSRHEWAKSESKGYWDVHARQFGFSLSGSGRVGNKPARSDFLQVFYGAQTHDSSTTQSWSKFLPWTQWRHVRHSLYDMDGNHFADMPDRGRYIETLDEREAIQKACPSATFEFIDFDGQKLAAQARIEEREWRAGEGWFKWLSWFRKPMISRSLDLRFSEEVGERKGSWKGGTIGHSIAMTPGELHASAFRRYCAERGLTFVAVMGQGDIPHGVYWDDDTTGSGDFYSKMTGTRLGMGFREAWIDRKAEFPGKPVRPQQDEAAAMVRKD